MNAGMRQLCRKKKPARVGNQCGPCNLLRYIRGRSTRRITSVSVYGCSSSLSQHRRMELQATRNRLALMNDNDSFTLEAISPYLVLGQADDGGQPIVETARALHDLIVTFPPQGHYSVRTVEDECGPAIHCAFERKADADRLARSVGAIEIARYDGYRSERAFLVSDSLARNIRRQLAQKTRWPIVA